MAEARTVLGTIKKFSEIKSKEAKFVKEGNPVEAKSFSCGILIIENSGEETWHNLSMWSEPKLKEELGKFQVGDAVVIIEDVTVKDDKTFTKIKTMATTGDKPQKAANNNDVFRNGSTINNNSNSKGPGVDKRIVRQNSLTQANSFVGNLLKQVELGIIEKDTVQKLEPLTIINYAKIFEDYVFSDNE